MSRVTLEVGISYQNQNIDQGHICCHLTYYLDIVKKLAGQFSEISIYWKYGLFGACNSFFSLFSNTVIRHIFYPENNLIFYTLSWYYLSYSTILKFFTGF